MFERGGGELSFVNRSYVQALGPLGLIKPQKAFAPFTSPVLTLTTATVASRSLLQHPIAMIGKTPIDRSRQESKTGNRNSLLRRPGLEPQTPPNRKESVLVDSRRSPTRHLNLQVTLWETNRYQRTSVSKLCKSFEQGASQVGSPLPCGENSAQQGEQEEQEIGNHNDCKAVSFVTKPITNGITILHTPHTDGRRTECSPRTRVWQGKFYSKNTDATKECPTDTPTKQHRFRSSVLMSPRSNISPYRAGNLGMNIGDESVEVRCSTQGRCPSTAGHHAEARRQAGKEPWILNSSPRNLPLYSEADHAGVVPETNNAHITPAARQPPRPPYDKSPNTESRPRNPVYPWRRDNTKVQDLRQLFDNQVLSNRFLPFIKTPKHTSLSKADFSQKVIASTRAAIATESISPTNNTSFPSFLMKRSGHAAKAKASSSVLFKSPETHLTNPSGKTAPNFAFTSAMGALKQQSRTDTPSENPRKNNSHCSPVKHHICLFEALTQSTSDLAISSPYANSSKSHCGRMMIKPTSNTPPRAKRGSSALHRLSDI